MCIWKGNSTWKKGVKEKQTSRKHRISWKIKFFKKSEIQQNYNDSENKSEMIINVNKVVFVYKDSVVLRAYYIGLKKFSLKLCSLTELMTMDWKNLVIQYT